MSGARDLAVALAGFVVLGVGLDLLTGEFSYVPGYGAGIGLAAATLFVVAYKVLGTSVLGRPEDYYPDDAPPDRNDDLAAAPAGEEGGDG